MCLYKEGLAFPATSLMPEQPRFQARDGCLRWAVCEGAHSRLDESEFISEPYSETVPSVDFPWGSAALSVHAELFVRARPPRLVQR